MSTHRKRRAYQRQIMYKLGAGKHRWRPYRFVGVMSVEWTVPKWAAAAWMRGMRERGRRTYLRQEAIATAVARSVLTAMQVIGSEEAP